MRIRHACLGILFSVCLPAAFACGYCIEDKIAATYDHQVIAKAVSMGHAVAYAEIVGMPGLSTAAEKEITGVVKKVLGVDLGTVRISLETPALSFAYDPRHFTPDGLLLQINRNLAPKRFKVSLIRIIQ
ncbi:MAG TPA: hypothetical protein VHE58_00155 [Burkholderiales bacterium]|nr:hypothetical protein [Burkholderiales bacterium]